MKHEAVCWPCIWKSCCAHFAHQLSFPHRLPVFSFKWYYAFLKFQLKIHCIILQFQHFDAALKEYNRKTGKDIATNPLATGLLRCDASNDVLDVLRKQAHAFNQYRNGDWRVQVMRRLRPTVDILLGLSASGDFGGIPAKAIFAGIGFLFTACISSLLGCLGSFTPNPKGCEGS